MKTLVLALAAITLASSPCSIETIYTSSGVTTCITCCTGNYCTTSCY